MRSSFHRIRAFCMQRLSNVYARSMVEAYFFRGYLKIKTLYVFFVADSVILVDGAQPRLVVLLLYTSLFKVAWYFARHFTPIRHNVREINHRGPATSCPEIRWLKKIINEEWSPEWFTMPGRRLHLLHHFIHDTDQPLPVRNSRCGDPMASHRSGGEIIGEKGAFRLVRRNISKNQNGDSESSRRRKCLQKRRWRGEASDFGCSFSALGGEGTSGQEHVLGNRHRRVPRDDYTVYSTARL